MEGQLSTFAACGFGVRTSLEAHNRLSCPRSADTALKTLSDLSFNFLPQDLRFKMHFWNRPRFVLILGFRYPRFADTACGWEDLSSKVPSSSRAGGNGGRLFARETTLICASGVS